jgi:uncharacterized membrane protein YfcA
LNSLRAGTIPESSTILIIFAFPCYYTLVPAAKIGLLIAIFFVTSVVSVVTGSTSLITIPAMISLGVEPHAAIATNMLALTFMSVGGFVPFVGKGILVRGKRLHISILLTLIGSALGAMVLLAVPIRILKIIIAFAMVAVAGFTIKNRNFGTETRVVPTSGAVEFSGYVATFVLAIYGGFFSGGYVTLLTAAFVVLLSMNFLQAVATTKVINFFSSAIATLVFLWRGVVDVRLGVILGISMFIGALLEGRIVLRLRTVWLRRVFVAAVLALAINMLWTLH